MDLQTRVDIPLSTWQIEPCERVLCVGSCFADNIGQRIAQDQFPVTVNPFGVMYNPISVLHTIEKMPSVPDITILSLGTNHVYIDKKTNSVVDNCQKRPAVEFTEKELTVEECAVALRQTLLHCGAHVIFTVSPIRYKKYSFHGSQLSKATLLLAVDKVIREHPAQATYFPAYEIVNDELRDYRFYAPDMLHPTSQTIDYLYYRFVEIFFSDAAKEYLSAWQPLKEALAHRPLHPDSEEYKAFLAQTKQRVLALREQYPCMVLPSLLTDNN